MPFLAQGGASGAPFLCVLALPQASFAEVRLKKQLVPLLACISAFSAICYAQTPKPDPPKTENQPCVIVQRQARKWADAGVFTGKQMHPFAYVEGGYPAKFKWRSELSEKNVRELQEKGGKVVVMKLDYQLSDLEDARKQCQSQTVK